MAISGGNFAKPGSRREGEFTIETLKQLLSDDVRLEERSEEHGDQLDGIGEAEIELILDRARLFGEPCTVPTEGKMYDIVAQVVSGGLLGNLE